MSSILVINAAGRETRVALVENGHIAEFYHERKKDRGIVGNIYKGKVVRVLPGMQAAFVDVGLEKAAFLYVTDVFYDPDFSRSQFELTEGEHEETAEVPEEIHEGTEEALAQSAGHALEFDVQELPPGELSPPPDGRRITGEIPALTDPAVPAISGPGEERTDPGIALVQAELDDADDSDVDRERSEPSATPLPPSADVGSPATAGTVPETGTPFTPTTADVATVTVSDETAEAASPASLEASPAAVVEGAPPPANGAAHTANAKEEVRGERRAPREERPREKHRRDRDGKPRRDRAEEEKSKARKSARIEDLLKVGQEVLVQISKDPIGTKGARLTCHISIPGRHLVFMPTVDHVGISRRIANEKERRRLREIVDRLRPPGTGFIVRTVAENVPQEKLEADIRFLIEVWNETVRKNEKRGGPGLMHSDLDLILRATRDLFAQDVEKLVVDDRDEYERICNFVAAQDPALRDRVLLHDSDDPIFDAYGIEDEIRRATQRKVWLKSGGYLIMDQAEALTAIDVNSGRYVGK
ncbi:MAG: ribonuclease E/G, partial [Myxococcaceae bacterium]